MERKGWLVSYTTCGTKVELAFFDKRPGYTTEDSGFARAGRFYYDYRYSTGIWCNRPEYVEY